MKEISINDHDLVVHTQELTPKKRKAKRAKKAGRYSLSENGNDQQRSNPEVQQTSH